MTRPSSRFRTTDLGAEARCSKCRDWWPADGEFYFMLRGRPHSWCKACYIADKVAKGRNPGYGRGTPHQDHARQSA